MRHGMIIDEYYKLNNGMRIPKVALGTWQVPENNAAKLVAAAIKAGYKHIDTAIAYGNEVGVGEGVKAGLASTGIHRESVFITTKIPAEVKKFSEAVKSIEASYERLDSFFIDMMLIHAPKPWDEMWQANTPKYYEENLAVWKALIEANDAGKVRSIGVSNFGIDDIKNIMDGSGVKPAVNQIRVHIGCVPVQVIEFCQQNGIMVEAYSPNATGRLMKNNEIVEIAKKYDVSVPQLASRFTLQLGLLPLPKSSSEEHIVQNAKLDFEINYADMAKLLAIKCV